MNPIYAIDEDRPSWGETLSAHQDGDTKLVSMGHSIRQALSDALSSDESVLVFGQDVGRLGGVFRVTSGLQSEYGIKRVFDTPASEAGAVGAAIGMAINGMRPVVELQFDAFAYPAFEQITSHLAKLRNRTLGRVRLPIVIRVPVGGGVGAVEHHSDSSEAYYVHTPGLQVVMPSTPQDAYDMLRQAINNEDPVIFLEPKKLYWAKGPLATAVAIGVPGVPKNALVRRSGNEVTIVTYGAMVSTCLEAAEVSAELGWDVEVIDLRTLAPFDDETVCASVRKTGRALVVHEASQFAGFGAEIAARVTEQCFHYLHAPIGRVTGLDVPYPPPLLERHFLPNVDRIITALASLQWEEGV